MISKIIRTLKNFKRTRYIEQLVADGLVLGEGVSIVDDFFFDRSHCYLISIGARTTIAPSVKLIAHDASTKRHVGYSRFGRVDIGEDCFIGHSSIVMPGVTIGNRSVVGAGSVVTKDVPPNCIVAGNPAKVIYDLDDFLDRIRKDAEAYGVFGYEYEISQLTPEKREELISAASQGKALIV